MVFQTSTSSTSNALQVPARQSRSSTHPNPSDPSWEIFLCPTFISWHTRQSTSLDPACAFVRSPFLPLPAHTGLHRDALVPFPSLPDNARGPSPAQRTALHLPRHELVCHPRHARSQPGKQAPLDGYHSRANHLSVARSTPTADYTTSVRPSNSILMHTPFAEASL